jgi:hypothetical protein
VEGCVELGDVDAAVVERAVAVSEQLIDLPHACGVGVDRLFEQRGDLDKFRADRGDAVVQQRGPTPSCRGSNVEYPESEVAVGGVPGGAAQRLSKGDAAARAQQPLELALRATCAPASTIRSWPKRGAWWLALLVGPLAVCV